MYFGPGSASGPALVITQTTPSGGIKEIGAPLNQLVVNGSGWYLSDVAAINDAGQIVGTGYHNGQQRAFLLTPGAPAPTGPSIYAIVGAGLSVPPITSITTGGWFSVFGFDFVPPAGGGTVINNGVGVSEQNIVGGSLPTNLNQTCVEVNGTQSPLDYVGGTQLNVQAPLMTPGTTASVTVIANCGTGNEMTSVPLSVPVVAQAPEFLYFTQSISGQNPHRGGERADRSGGEFLGIWTGAFRRAFPHSLRGWHWEQPRRHRIPGVIAIQAALVNGSVSVSIGNIPASISYAGISSRQLRAVSNKPGGPARPRLRESKRYR